MAKKYLEKVLRYNAVFEPAEEGGYTVSVPKLPGLFTEGDSFEEAMEMAKDAVVGYLEVSNELGEEIPEPDVNTFAAPIDIQEVKNRFVAC